MGAPKKSEERVKLVMDEREKFYFQKLPLALRQRIAQCLDQPELIPPDRRRGEFSHWEKKRAEKVFVVRTPDRKKHAATPAEAAAMVDCSEDHLMAHMNKPLTRFERVRTYVMNGRLGETIVMWSEHAIPTKRVS